MKDVLEQMLNDMYPGNKWEVQVTENIRDTFYKVLLNGEFIRVGFSQKLTERLASFTDEDPDRLARRMILDQTKEYFNKNGSNEAKAKERPNNDNHQGFLNRQNGKWPGKM